jgi:hypothetical protein
MFLAIFFAALITLFLTTEWFNKPFLGLDRLHLVLIVAGLYLLIILIIHFLDYNYFYFNDDNDPIVIRYYPMRPLARKKREIRIPKINLAGFEIKRSFLGLRKSLLIRQKTKKGAATYPAIGITALTGKEISMIAEQLKRYVRA